MRVISWLGQLVAGRADSAPEVERRIWVRPLCEFPADASAQGPSDGPRLSAVVRGAARGGLELLFDEPVDEGSFLCVELPGQQSSDLLAYIVHAEAKDDGRWEVGCTFSLELDDDDLQLLGSERRKSSPPDRRRWERLPGRGDVRYQVVGPSSSNWQTAQIADLSPGGIGLRVTQPEPLRAIMRLELSGGDRAEPLVILASVIRATAVEEGVTVLGCSFIRELELDELESLLTDDNG
jgi:hypothetical protein